jgi:hypothetical protein
MHMKNMGSLTALALLLATLCTVGINSTPMPQISPSITQERTIGTQIDGGSISSSGFTSNLEYPATDSFQGGYSSWNVPFDWTAAVVTKNYHLTALQVTGINSNEMSYAMTPSTNGSVEFYILVQDTVQKAISLRGDGAYGVSLEVIGGELMTYGAAGLEMGRFGRCILSLNTWHAITIEFECTTSWFQGLGSLPLEQYHFNVWVDSQLQFKNVHMLNNISSVNEFEIWQYSPTTTFIDAFETSDNPGHLRIDDQSDVASIPLNTVVHDIVVHGITITIPSGKSIYVDGVVDIKSTGDRSTGVAGQLIIEAGASLDTRDGFVYSGSIPMYQEGDWMDSDVIVGDLEALIGDPSMLPPPSSIELRGTAVSTATLKCDGLVARDSEIYFYYGTVVATHMFHTGSSNLVSFNATRSTVTSYVSISIDCFGDTGESSIRESPAYSADISYSTINTGMIWFEGEPSQETTTTCLIRYSEFNGMLNCDWGSQYIIQNCRILALLFPAGWETFAPGMTNVVSNNEIVLNSIGIVINLAIDVKIEPRRSGDTFYFKKDGVPVPSLTGFVGKKFTGSAWVDLSDAEYLYYQCWPASDANQIKVEIPRFYTLDMTKLHLYNCSTPSTRMVWTEIADARNSSFAMFWNEWGGGITRSVINCEFFSLKEFFPVTTPYSDWVSWNRESMTPFSNGLVGIFCKSPPNVALTFVNCWFHADQDIIAGFPGGSEYFEHHDSGFAKWFFTLIDCRVTPSTQFEFFDKGSTDVQFMVLNSIGAPANKYVFEARKSQYMNGIPVTTTALTGRLYVPDNIDVNTVMTVELEGTPYSLSEDGDFTIPASAATGSKTLTSRTTSGGSVCNRSLTFVASTYQAPVLGTNYFTKSISLSPSTPTATLNYPVKVLLPSSPANSNGLRFFLTTGTECDYWIESWVVGSTSTIWVEAFTAGTTAMVLYYGLGLPGGSNGDATFPLFDDFLGTTVDSRKWNVETDAYSTVTVSGGQVDVKSQASSNTAIGAYSGLSNFYIAHASGTAPTVTNATTYGGGNNLRTVRSGTTTQKTDTHAAAWYTFDVCRTSSTSAKFYKNNALLFTITTNVPTGTLSAKLASTVKYSNKYYAGVLSSAATFGVGYAVRMRAYHVISVYGDVKCDWIFVRPCLATEPVATVT